MLSLRDAGQDPVKNPRRITAILHAHRLFFLAAFHEAVHGHDIALGNLLYQKPSGNIGMTDGSKQGT